MPSPASTLDMATDLRTQSGVALSSRNNLKKQGLSKDPDDVKGFKRFSKRQSKSGLPPVF